MNHENNSFVAYNFKISTNLVRITLVQRNLEEFHRTEQTDKLPRGGNKPFK